MLDYFFLFFVSSYMVYIRRRRETRRGRDEKVSGSMAPAACAVVEALTYCLCSLDTGKGFSFLFFVRQLDLWHHLCETSFRRIIRAIGRERKKEQGMALFMFSFILFLISFCLIYRNISTNLLKLCFQF